jgi:hypothetical protein
MAPRDQCRGDVAANEAGAACDEHFHSCSKRSGRLTLPMR